MKTEFRVSNKGNGEILNSSGNPINGWERERIVFLANENLSARGYANAAQTAEECLNYFAQNDKWPKGVCAADVSTILMEARKNIFMPVS